MKCKICQDNTNPLFSVKVLNKYDVQYYQCPNCEFIQTEKPYWLEEAYQNAITDLDIGLVNRNLEFSQIIHKVITNSLNYKKTFLDYAGGYGLFTRIMRDKGLNYYSYDKYCENFLAINYNLKNLQVSDKFEAITALEVFEHLEDPLIEIKKILTLSDTIIFSTELIPNTNITNVNDWWYFSQETGQHIAFYSTKTLLYIADLFKLNYYNQGSLHIFSTKKFSENPFNNQAIINLPSLLENDFQNAKKIANKIKPSLTNTDKKIENTQEKLFDNLSLLLNKIEKLEQKNISLKDQHKSTQEQLNSALVQLQQSVDKLHEIYSSTGWKTLRHLYLIRDFFFPQNSSVKKYFKENLFKIKNLKLRLYNIHYQLNTKKNINLKSKKIVYIGHSYHTKTKSTAFLIEYLKKHFDVTEVIDESWSGKKPFPDLSFIDKSYLGVIFFQNIPSQEIIKNINNDNIIFFPMYDSSRKCNKEFWEQYKNLKIINFSKTLHQKLISLGLNSIYVQYFPKPLLFIKNKTYKVFFWQRTNAIDINLVEKLLDNLKIQIHIHRAVDPNCTFVKPTKEQEKKFKITYSNWFKTREEMQQKMQECDIYIAPREYEGIGMSFLEAMAMGKVVIAANNPTMNEYIINNQTGYLFDKDNPKPINFSKSLKIRNNTYNYMRNGYINWEKEKNKIIEFMKK